MTEPLNPVLFNALARVFGHSPKISNDGEPFSYEAYQTPFGWKMNASGEAYAVCCPDCGDDRYRLYFNHRFGTCISDPRFQGVLLDLAFCQHEQRKKSKWFKLLGEALDDPQVALLIREKTKQATLNGTNDSVFGSVPSMGDTTPLRELDPGHQAVVYLRARGYDPLYLNDTYGACLINDHPMEKIRRMAVGRVAFPFYIDGELKTWQARLTYDHGEKFPPKWYFPPGRKWPWAIDVASHFPVVVICEGILSAVNFGPAAIAIGGKTLTYNAKKIVVEKWKNVIVALDPDAGINRKPDQQDYHSRLIKSLKEEGLNVAGVQWTAGDNRDPGDLGPIGCYQLLQRSCPHMLAMLPYFSAA